MASARQYKFPVFYNYPPYFTLQPVQETRDRQEKLWTDLILDFCKFRKVFVIDLDEFDLFSNPSIERKLSYEGRRAFVAALVKNGQAEWLDTEQRRCLVLWRKVEEWAQDLLRVAQENGWGGSVVLLDELTAGAEVAGTDLEGLDRTVLMRALALLERQGRVEVFTGSSDEEGVKFFL